MKARRNLILEEMGLTPVWQLRDRGDGATADGVVAAVGVALGTAEAGSGILSAQLETATAASSRSKIPANPRPLIRPPLQARARRVNAPDAKPR